MFLHVAHRMVESKDVLTQADKAIGDSDHGIGMARGFEAVIEKLQSQDFTSVEDLLKMIGMTLLTTIGGAAGAIYGTLFIGGSKELANRSNFDTDALSNLLANGLSAVKKRGKANPGDKTLVDALEPAAEAAKGMVKAPINESLPVIVEAARQGMEDTKGMIASVGRARSLGERSLGHVDPGALSMYLLLSFMDSYLRGKGNNCLPYPRCAHPDGTGR